MLPAIQVNWTKPYFDKQRLRGECFKITREIENDTYDMPDYQIFYTMVSAIHWRNNNGSLKLYTDSIGLEFIQQFYMNELYDEIDIKFLNGYSKTNIDAAQFWTSGKIKVLAHQTKPFIFLDQDMIVRTPIPERLLQNDVTITHWEIPRGDVYFNESSWNREIPNIPKIPNFSYTDLVPNTSFLAFNNIELLQKYTNSHKDLVNINGVTAPIWYWLLTDQGILGHIVRKNDYKVSTLTDKVWLVDQNFGTPKDRYKGIAEPWYYPTTNVDKKKDKEFKWEHVWINKIHYGLFPEHLKGETQRFFNEVVDLGHADKVTNGRFSKYWKEREKSNL